MIESGWPLPRSQALGYHGSESAGLILRLKARLGDREPEVLSECLCGLLACGPKENLPLVSGYLNLDDIPVREAAILALGRSRLPEAFAVLSAFWNRQPPCGLAGDRSPCHGHASPSRGDRIPDRAGRHRSRARLALRPIRAQDPRARFTAPPADRGGDSAKEHARAAGKV